MKLSVKLLATTILTAASLGAANASLSGSVSYFSQSYGDGLKATGARFTLGYGFTVLNTLTVGPEFSYARGTLNRSSYNSDSYYDLSAGAFANLRLNYDLISPELRVSAGYAGAKFFNRNYLNGVYSQVGVGVNVLGSAYVGVSYRYTHLSNSNRDYSGSSYSFNLGFSF
ncbi:hypothetical protein CKF54_05460 [Psittacicella hinzii]|uniref:Outer membrane protein beta-barrel domain-containing protein n=1 Tax=Psittacicella hinzii TaxID=2028575 RepID=A0A3A1Y455_9GAMM|nr:hypothetical protein [Psittacicella hinzii]RIY32036.1 hypothetical protein CKF54_05460 [Psittacicella hinzii]